MAKFGETSVLVKCSFCGKSQKQVKKLIPGPGVYICDECIDLCKDIIHEKFSEPAEVRIDERPKPLGVKCSFCRRSQKPVKKLIAGPGVYICDVCINLCNDIIEEELS